jgi:MinD superfamily P-loop ATPase
MEMTVISGKGGTGKTTMAMALAELSQSPVLVDCDVDAPNLYLYHKGENVREEDFFAMKKAVIDTDKCTQCGLCAATCRFDAIHDTVVNAYHCEGCGACLLVCPEGAIRMVDEKCATAYITRTNHGYISRAQMEIGADGSGKLVTLLRKNAREIVPDGTLVINDGSPGIGCAVIASITASDFVLIVTEPTQSGYDDFVRVASLCAHFGIDAMACINKCDINTDMADRIAGYCRDNGIDVVGRIPYDESVTQSINALRPVTDYPDSPAAKAVGEIWKRVEGYLFNH